MTTFRPSLQNFRSFAFLAGFALLPKSRKVTKIDHTVKLQIFELSRFLLFLAGVALLPKSREVTKIDDTVWPPPINRRKNRKDSHFHSGRVQVLLCCACVKPLQSSSGHSGSARSDPNQSRQPPPPRRTNQKAPNEPDAGTRCNTTTTHPHSHSVHAN